MWKLNKQKSSFKAFQERLFLQNKNIYFSCGNNFSFLVQCLKTKNIKQVFQAQVLIEKENIFSNEKISSCDEFALLFPLNWICHNLKNTPINFVTRKQHSSIKHASIVINTKTYQLLVLSSIHASLWIHLKVKLILF